MNDIAAHSSIVNWYIINRSAFDALDYKTDYKIIENIIGQHNLRRIIYNEPFSKEEIDLEITGVEVIPASEISVPVIRKLKFHTYQRKVHNLTRSNPEISSLTNYDLWKTRKALTRTEFFSNYHYTIDHKISIFWCWKRNIPVEIPAHISNLRIITGRENTIKNKSNYIDEYNQWIYDQYK